MSAFHGAEFEIIDGCYYNSGRNNKQHDVIKNLYSLRLTLNNDKHPAQVAIELLMKSMCEKLLFNQLELILS